MAINTLSNPNKLGNNGGRLYGFANRPVLIDCHFTVSSSDSGGLGITSLSGQGVNTVFMYTSASAGIGPNGVSNPMAQTASKGYIQVQLANNYKSILGIAKCVVSPTTGSAKNVDASDAALTVGVPYVITSLGTSTQADFQAIGLPVGVIPAVGSSFIAIATGAGTGTGQVKAVGVSSSVTMEIIGTPNGNIAPIPLAGISPNIGATLLLQVLGSAFNYNSGTPASSTVTMAPVEIADGSLVYLQLLVAA